MISAVSNFRTNNSQPKGNYLNSPMANSLNSKDSYSPSFGIAGHPPYGGGDNSQFPVLLKGLGIFGLKIFVGLPMEVLGKGLESKKLLRGAEKIDKMVEDVLKT